MYNNFFKSYANRTHNKLSNNDVESKSQKTNKINERLVNAFQL